MFGYFFGNYFLNYPDLSGDRRQLPIMWNDGLNRFGDKGGKVVRTFGIIRMEIYRRITRFTGRPLL